MIPPGALEVKTFANGSTYSEKCADNPGGKAGWSDVSVISTYEESTLPSSQVVDSISSQLARLGWHRVAPVWDHNFDQYQPRAAWQKTLWPGQTATASVYQLPAGNGPYTGSWHFGADAHPPGFALPGC